MHEIFNTREQALIIWGVIFMLAFLFKQDVRKALLGVLKSSFQKLFLKLYLVNLVYCSTFLTILFWAGIWESKFLKDSIVWFSMVSIPLTFKAYGIRNNDFFKRMVIQAMSLTAIIEFIINLNTFPLYIEIISLPIVSFLTVLVLYTSEKSEHRVFNAILNRFLALIGLLYLTISIFTSLKNLNAFLQSETLIKLGLPIVLTIGLIPLIYSYALYYSYESLLRLVKFRLKDEIEYGYIRRRLIDYLGINLTKINEARMKSTKMNLQVNPYRKHLLERFLKKL